MTLHADAPSPTLAQSLIRMTSEQYHRIMEEGIIPEDASTELLNGFIVARDRGELGQDIMGHSPNHALVVALLGALAGRINSLERHLRIQLPVAISLTNEPEPDATIVRGQPRDYAKRLPGGTDVFCVIEAAHSSLDKDRQDKTLIYGRTGIPQYVIINLQARQVEVYEGADGGGVYRTRTLAGEADKVRLALGDGEFLEISGGDILP